MKIKKKIYITVALFLIADFLIVFFVLKPLYWEIKEVSDQFLERRKKIVQLERKIREIKGLKKTYAEIKPDFKKIESLFVVPDKPIRFITFLEETADESGVTANISPGSGLKLKNENWDPVVFKIESSGTFPSLLKFIEEIEYGPWVVLINDLKIRKIKKKEEDVEQEVKRVNAVFELRAYSKENN